MLQICVAWHRGVRWSGPEQTGGGEDEGGGENSYACAQKARGITEEGKLPPEFVRILHMFIGEQPEPEGTPENKDNGHNPVGAERLTRQGGLPVEMGAAGPERAEHE